MDCDDDGETTTKRRLKKQSNNNNDRKTQKSTKKNDLKSNFNINNLTTHLCTRLFPSVRSYENGHT